MDTTELCPICFEDLDINIYTTVCNHKFHVKCYRDLVEYEINKNKKDVLCPLCKKIIHLNTQYQEEEPQPHPMYMVIEIPNNNNSESNIGNMNYCSFTVTMICFGIFGLTIWYNFNSNSI